MLVLTCHAVRSEKVNEKPVQYWKTRLPIADENSTWWSSYSVGTHDEGLMTDWELKVERTMKG